LSKVAILASSQGDQEELAVNTLYCR